MTNDELEAGGTQLLLYGLTEFAAEIPGMNRKKLSVYFKRGKLPEPFAKAGNRYFWSYQQVKEFSSSFIPLSEEELLKKTFDTKLPKIVGDYD